MSVHQRTNRNQITGAHVNAWGFRWHSVCHYSTALLFLFDEKAATKKKQECTRCAHCQDAITGTDGFFDDDINKPVHLRCLK